MGQTYRKSEFLYLSGTPLTGFPHTTLRSADKRETDTSKSTSFLTFVAFCYSRPGTLRQDPRSVGGKGGFVLTQRLFAMDPHLAEWLHARTCARGNLLAAQLQRCHFGDRVGDEGDTGREENQLLISSPSSVNLGTLNAQVASPLAVQSSAERQQEQPCLERPWGRTRKKWTPAWARQTATSRSPAGE